MTFEMADKQAAEAILTSKRQEDDDREGARMVSALESAWAAIRSAHPDVPRAVLVVASGTMQRGQLRLGHYGHGRWARKDDTEMHLPEVMISGEGMRRSADEVMGTLLHEAAHGVAATRKIKDTSRGGRYHNRAFKRSAEELGLEVATQGSHGLASTKMSAATAGLWAQVIAALGEALQAFRFAEASGEEKQSSRMLLAVCHCRTKIRLSQEAYDAAPIMCSACGREFVLKQKR